MKKILPLLLLLLCCITVYAQERYTFEKITVTLTKDNLHPAQVLRTRKLNKYNKPVYEENYYLCYPTTLTGCNRDSSELENIVFYEYSNDTILTKKTVMNVPMKYILHIEDTITTTYEYNIDNKLAKEQSISREVSYSCTSNKVWQNADTMTIYHKYDNKGLLHEDIIERSNRPRRSISGYEPEDMVKYNYDNRRRLTRMEHYNIWSMGSDEKPENSADTVLTYTFTYDYEADRRIEKVVRMQDGQADTVNTIIHYNDPYRNVLPYYVKTPERFYTIYLYDHKNKLLSERTYGGADNILMTEKRY